jgi:parvulin-like peptidyl-prolyl isomerase
MGRMNDVQTRDKSIEILLGLAAIFVAGCSDPKKGLSDAEMSRIALTQKIELVKASGGLVLMVGGETLSSSEILETALPAQGKEVSLAEYLKPMAQSSNLDQFKQQGRAYVEEVLTGKISNLLLYQYAKKETGDSEQVKEYLDQMAEKELRQFVMRYGGDQAKADEAIAKMGIDREKFKEEQKKRMITQSYISSKMPRNQPITYSQLKDCYERVKDRYFLRAARLTFRLIDIDVTKVKLSDSNTNLIDEAKRLAEEVMAKLKAGEDFGKLAEQYSHDHRRTFGGLWQPISPDALARPYDVLAKEAEKIDPGQVAGPIDTGGHVFIMKLEDKQTAGYEPFEKVQRQVMEIVEAERRDQIVRDLTTRFLSQAAVGQRDEFVEFCLEKIYQLNRQ